jgi:hypothetical protein
VRENPQRSFVVKKGILVLVVLAVLAAGGAFGQEKAANVRNNWVSGELSLIGIGASYERMAGAKFSVGLDAYWNSLFFFWNELEAGVFGRFYPKGRSFFLEAGLGYHVHTSLSLDDSKAITGFSITPALGWKIDVGKPGGFFIRPGVKFPITLGTNDLDNEFDTGVGFLPYISLGGAF